jgi:predicted pyridoxine 5'-phosphate oxidase superfamily flavin-nucleotide-binding protein
MPASMPTNQLSSDVAFSPAVKAVQVERGSRGAYSRLEARGGFETQVTPELAGFLAEIDTAYLATASADGQPYVQHRGGPKGFIRVVDEATIGFLDLAGNRQYVTTGNLRDNDRVCLFLIDYAHRARVKIWGRARVVPAADPAAAGLALPAGAGRPEQAILITVTAWDANCPKYIPQKVDVAEVEPVVTALRQQVSALEQENRALKATLARQSR